MNVKDRERERKVEKEIERVLNSFIITIGVGVANNLYRLAKMAISAVVAQRVCLSASAASETWCETHSKGACDKAHAVRDKII